MPLLSIVIPGRNEMFMTKTVENVLANIRGDTDIIVVADGYWPTPVIKDHPKVNIIHFTEPVGQRAATNAGVKISKAKFVCKLDAHCAIEEGFDVKMIDPYIKKEIDTDAVSVPSMLNLHAYDWVCKCGYRMYQGPTPEACPECRLDGKPFTLDILWLMKPNPRSDFMRFDSQLHFQYWRDYRKRPEARGDLCDLMSFIGACWVMSRHRYRKLGLLDEKHGSWGQVGTEVACAAWLSGGRLIVNKRTCFSHLFRTQGADFGFPYKITGKEQETARKYSNHFWKETKWKHAIRPLSWIVEKFWPVPGWTEEDMIELKKMEKKLT